MAELVYTQGFVDDAAHTQIPEKREYVLSAADALSMFPEMGSANVPRSIRSRYGSGIRKLSAKPFLIVYEYHADADEVHLLGLHVQTHVV